MGHTAPRSGRPLAGGRRRDPGVVTERSADGRVEWLVTWGQPMRADWHTAVIVAWDPEEARVTARELFPDRLAPTGVFAARGGAAP